MLQQFSQPLDLVTHVVAALDLLHVSVEVRQHRPQVGQHSGLLGEVLADRVGLVQNVSILRTQIRHVVLAGGQLLQPVDQLEALGNRVLILDFRVNGVNYDCGGLVLHLRHLDVQLEFALARTRAHTVFDYGEDGKIVGLHHDCAVSQA